ncbi:MAG: helix-turn-helix transcriptional regulator [Gemmataceae bacterium]|nr:helix-turn-helix transcriptional regulator [Gemmataceae bacterium]
MSTSTIEPNNLTAELLRFAPLFQAYMECSDELQAHARKLFATLTDPQTDADDRALAAMTLADVLFPNLYQGELGSDLEECEAMGAQHSEETRETLERMDREEATFADRLREVMQERGVTQVQLAEQLGVGQSAIAMMLQRQCQPQRRTVARMAAALGVAPERLWPNPGR